MMDYTMFQKVVKMQIRDYLPESFKDAEVEIKSVTKVNKVKDSLIIRADDERVVPNFYLDDLYENYKETQDLEAVLHSVADAYVKHLENGREMKIPEFTKEFISENVVMAMINTQSNREMLAGIPHRDINDCSIVYRVMVDKSGDGIATAVVGNDMAESVGLTEEELFLAATENTKRLLPVKIQSMNEIMMGMMMAEGMPKEIAEEMFSSMSPQDAPTMWIITNDRGVNGAVNMLYDENLQHLAKELKDDLYILPSSIHEVICIPASMGDPKVLAEMVQEVNATVVSLEERLSNQVYHYDKDLRKLTMATDSPNRGIDSMVAEQPLIYEAKEQKR